MKVALVTNNLPHHKFWAYKLYQKFDVRLIITPKNQNRIENLKNKKLLRYGILFFIFKLISIFYNAVNNKSMLSSLERAENIFFKKYVEKYNSIPLEIKNTVKTVNDSYSINLIKKNNIDVICFLGGDIAKSNFIDSANLISLNYHSGLSPYYNGSKTIFHAFSDFRPNFCGGTLMVINEKIDGGDILSHYLPSIEANDTAASLFMKGIIGAVKLYSLKLTMLEDRRSVKGIKQTKSFKYVTFLDWNIINDLRLRHFEDKKMIKRYVRAEKIIDYDRREQTDSNFHELLENILE